MAPMSHVYQIVYSHLFAYLMVTSTVWRQISIEMPGHFDQSSSVYQVPTVRASSSRASARWASCQAAARGPEQKRLTLHQSILLYLDDILWWRYRYVVNCCHTLDGISWERNGSAAENWEKEGYRLLKTQVAGSDDSHSFSKYPKDQTCVLIQLG
jgi:hypothetical protein